MKITIAILLVSIAVTCYMQCVRAETEQLDFSEILEVDSIDVVVRYDPDSAKSRSKWITEIRFVYRHKNIYSNIDEVYVRELYSHRGMAVSPHGGSKTKADEFVPWSTLIDLRIPDEWMGLSTMEGRFGIELQFWEKDTDKPSDYLGRYTYKDTIIVKFELVENDPSVRHITHASECIKLIPIDEGPKNPSFVSFREKLFQAIESRDRTFLEDCISDEIIVQTDNMDSFIRNMRTQLDIDYATAVEKCQPYLENMKEERGKERFIKTWFEENSKTRLFTIWDKMRDILEHGGVFVDEEHTIFHAPYTWPLWPEQTDYDYATISDSIIIKYAGQNIDTLSYDLICKYGPAELIVGGSPRDEILIRTHDGKIGWIAAKELREPSDYGMEIRNSDSGWKITKFARFP